MPGARMSTSGRCRPGTSRCTTSPGTTIPGRPGRRTRAPETRRTRPGAGPSGFPAPKPRSGTPASPRRPATTPAISARRTSTASSGQYGEHSQYGAGPVPGRRRVRGRVRGGAQVRPRLRRRRRRRLRGRPARPPRPPGQPPGQPRGRAGWPPPQAQVPLDRAAGRAAGHRHPAGRGRRLRLQPLHEQVPPGRLLGRRHRLRRGPGPLGCHRGQPRAEAGAAGRGGQFPRVRPGGRAQFESGRPAARLLRDAQAHAGVAGLRAAAQPEEPGAGHGDDPGGLAAEPDHGLARRQIRHPGQRLRQGRSRTRRRSACPATPTARPRATCSPRPTRSCRTKPPSAC